MTQDLFEPFEPYTRSRVDDPETSHEAATKIAYKMTALRSKVLGLYYRHTAMTDLDLQKLCGDHKSTYRTRRSELTQMGYIEDSGATKHQDGSNRTIWAITTAGMLAARALL